ncbi:MAG: hypothetical protein P1P90_00960 [Patescibacteria group bacterium]|nr:hypothetical protein [Patescibacteria group bacterium]
MQRGFILGSMVLLATISAGCANTESVSSSMNDSVVSGLKCQNLDYEISEFNLVSSMPTLSGSYNLNVSLEQLGDCKADELPISIYEDNNFVSQHKLINPGSTVPLTIKWAPKKDGDIKLTAKLELMDHDFDNNTESINILVYPLGNYRRINDLTSETFSAASPGAELLQTSVPIHVSDIEVYLQKATDTEVPSTLILQINTDDGGKPGNLIKQVEKVITLHDQFDWYSVPVDLSINAGDYWIQLTMKDSGLAKWHYSRKQAGGSQYLAGDLVKYETNKNSIVFTENTWRLLQDKDFSFKVHAGGSNE